MKKDPYEVTREDVCKHCLNEGDKELCVPDWSSINNHCFNFDGEE